MGGVGLRLFSRHGEPIVPPVWLSKPQSISMLGRQARIEHAAPPKIVLTRIQSIRAVHRHALGTRKEPHVSSGRCTGLCRSTPDGTFACPDGGISSHLKNAFAGEKSKFFFALYAAVHDEVNAVGPRIPKKLFKRAAVLNDCQNASFKVGHDPINYVRQICRSPDFMTPP